MGLISGVFVFVFNTTWYEKKFENTEAVNWRPENAMTKTKMTKGQTRIYKTLHRNLKIEQ